MKKKILTISALVALTVSTGFVATSCDSGGGGGKTPSATGPRLEVNYLRYDENYTNWGLWMWSDANPGAGYLFDSQQTFVMPNYPDETKWIKQVFVFDQDYTYFTDWNFTASESGKVDYSFFLEGDTSGIIFRDRAGTKDGQDDRHINPALADADGDEVYEIFAIEGDNNLYYSVESIPTSGVKGVYFDSLTTTRDILRIVSPIALDPQVTKETLEIKDAQDNVLSVSSMGGYSNGTLTVYLENQLTEEDLKKQYYLYLDDHPIADGSGYPIAYDYYYGGKRFEDLFTYDGELGSYIEGGETKFRLWAPTATEVKINIYDDGEATTPSSTANMTSAEKGTWTYSMSGNQHGKYYSFDVTVLGKTNTDVADPYGKSANANGKHSMVVDFSNSAVLPDNFAASKAPEVATASSPIVYETHVRDFTMNSSWTGTAANKGKYLGLSESGTTLSDNSTKTGFDYVKELGVTHVQLMPIYDFKSVDETKLDDSTYVNANTNGVYNWGYDPQSYNSPEGSYSSDPNDGNTRVKELREAIMAYNNSGIGIIMDVVYNHMPTKDGTTFDSIVPGYYFRGTNSSGAGADMASEKSMFKKFIVDSTKMWMENYKLAGFRFDLMGLITNDAMSEVSSELHEINEDAIVYGEGWSMFSNSPYVPSLQNTNMATQNNIKGIEVGAFNDAIRDGLKGSVFSSTDTGWATSTTADKALDKREQVKYGIVGTQTHSQVQLSSALPVYDTAFTGSNVVYAEAHDNMTLNDKLAISRPDISGEQAMVIQMFINNIVMTSYGISFFHSGTEFARSKVVPTDMISSVDSGKLSCTADNTVCYSNDSYNLNDKVNSIDWNLVKENSFMVDAFKAAAKLKTDNPLLRGTDYENMETRYVFENRQDITAAEATGLIAYTVSDGTPEGKKIYIVHNANDTSIIVSDHSGYAVALGSTLTTATNNMEVKPYSTLVLISQ